MTSLFLFFKRDPVVANKERRFNPLAQGLKNHQLMRRKMLTSWATNVR